MILKNLTLHDVGHVLLYKKIHVSTTLHWFDLSTKSQLTKIQILSKLWSWNPPQLPQLSNMSYLYYQSGCLHVFEQEQLKIDIFIHPTLTKIAAPRSSMFKAKYQDYSSFYIRADRTIQNILLNSYMYLWPKGGAFIKLFRER